MGGGGGIKKRGKQGDKRAALGVFGLGAGGRR